MRLHFLSPSHSHRTGRFLPPCSEEVEDKFAELLFQINSQITQFFAMVVSNCLKEFFKQDWLV